MDEVYPIICNTLFQKTFSQKTHKKCEVFQIPMIGRLVYGTPDSFKLLALVRSCLPLRGKGDRYPLWVVVDEVCVEGMLQMIESDALLFQ